MDQNRTILPRHRQRRGAVADLRPLLSQLGFCSPYPNHKTLTPETQRPWQGHSQQLAKDLASEMDAVSLTKDPTNNPREISSATTSVALQGSPPRTEHDSKKKSSATPEIIRRKQQANFR